MVPLPREVGIISDGRNQLHSSALRVRWEWHLFPVRWGGSDGRNQLHSSALRIRGEWYLFPVRWDGSDGRFCITVQGRRRGRYFSELAGRLCDGMNGIFKKSIFVTDTFL